MQIMRRLLAALTALALSRAAVEVTAPAIAKGARGIGGDL